MHNCYMCNVPLLGLIRLYYMCVVIIKSKCGNRNILFVERTSSDSSILTGRTLWNKYTK